MQQYGSRPVTCAHKNQKGRSRFCPITEHPFEKIKTSRIHVIEKMIQFSIVRIYHHSWNLLMLVELFVFVMYLLCCIYCDIELPELLFTEGSNRLDKRSQFLTNFCWNCLPSFVCSHPNQYYLLL